MKKITIVAAMLLTANIFAQQPPTGPTIPNSTNVPNKAGHAWFRGGNQFGGQGGGKNIFGTMWNSPIYTYTAGQPRMRLNGNLTNNINGHNQNRSGYLAIGNNSANFLSNPNLGAFSMLHLNGTTPPSLFQSLGHHDWMKTGITFTSNHDLAYVGMRSVNNQTNLTEFTLTWSNNPTQFGPDDMVFRFSNNGGRNNLDIDNNLTDNTDGDGLHVARFTGLGNMGLGPTFGVGNPLYVTPQSIMHISRDRRKATWLQITNQNGTRQTAQDGLRFGIRNGNNASAYLRWQEQTPFIIQTDWNNNAGGVNNGERMRISSINAPGVPHPVGLPNNTTRVAISHLGNSPITAPRSLLHLGYNTGSQLNPASTDGWRDWMDVGTFTNIGTDNMYVGLKREAGAFPANDRHDAVINWGDNGGNNPLNGPDNLRFIFTETQTSSVPGNAPATSNNGLEVARFTPELASTLAAPNYGMMGIGDFTVAAPIDAKLDIDGDLRIRQVTQDNALTQVLVIDPTDNNRVHWKDITPIVGGGFGSLCGSATPLQLTNSSEVQLNTFDFHFSGTGASMNENNVGIGTNCQNPLAGKLHVYRNSTTDGSTGAYILTEDNTNTTNNNSSIGLFVDNDGFTNDLATCRTVAAWFETDVNIDGSQNFAICVPQSGGIVSLGFNQSNLAANNNEPDVCGVWNTGNILEVNGNVYANNVTVPSDMNFKTNIAPITSALEKVKKLNGVYYDYDNTNYPNLNFSAERQVGFIAQNVDTVLTEVTKYDSSLQAYTMNYSNLSST